MLDLVRCDATALRSQFSVLLEKTVLELRGTSCLSLEELPAAKQQILVSRSFGQAVTEVGGLIDAVSEFASRAAEKLREQGGTAGAVNVFFTTSAFRVKDRQHSASQTLPLVRPTSDSRLLVSAAVDAVRRLFRPGFNYAKAGVVLMDLQAAGQQQGELDLFATTESPRAQALDRDRSALMAAMDSLNRRFGRDAVQIASAALDGQGAEAPSWSTRQDRRSPRYTTRWDEMARVRA